MTGLAPPRLTVLVLVLLVRSTFSLAPTPEQLAWVVSDRIVKNQSIFFDWSYGGALIFDGLWQVNHTFGIDYEGVLNKYLDRYATDENYYGYKVLHNQTIPWQGAIGDGIGLFPINYVNRALYSWGKPHYNSTNDLKIARTILEQYVLGWPRHLADGTISRNHGWDEQPGNSTFVWADDTFMGLTLASRLAMFDNRSDYAVFASQQQELFTLHLRDYVDGLSYHGFNYENGNASCCKWGRGNGWIMMSHIEVLEALEYLNMPEAATVKLILKNHIMAVTKVQSSDGRWTQLLDYPTSFLETSCTAMFLSTIARAARHRWLPDLPRWQYILEKAWSGLAQAVESTGEVTGICSGTGIQDTPQDYFHRPTDYYSSGPGGLGAVLRAAVDMQNFMDSL